VISWLAGLFYLPRLFVHHTERVAPGTDTDALFQMMEEKLFRVIMRPAMIVAWLAGLFMAFTPGVIDWGAGWVWLKAGGIFAMTGFHVWCKRRLAAFQAGRNRTSGRHYRMMNEVPTLLMLLIVVAVVVKPF
jgi:putative membrane protein